MNPDNLHRAHELTEKWERGEISDEEYNHDMEGVKLDDSMWRLKM